MMESFKFAKLDFVRAKGQSKLILLFLALGVFLSIRMDSPIWGMFYIIFGAMVMVTAPYFSDLVVEQGFIRLLPAHAGSRVYGRYLYGTMYLILSAILGLFVAIITILYTKSNTDYLVEAFFAVLGAGFLLNSLQFLVLSLIKTKNPQILSLIRLLIPFVLFFGGSALANSVSGGSAEVYGKLESIVEYIMTHTLYSSLFLLLVGLLVTILAALISARHESRLES